MLMKLILIFICILPASWAKWNKDQTLTFEIVKHKTAYEQWLNHRQEIENFSLGPSPKPPRQNDSIALKRFLNDQYYGEIVIGHPGQKLYVSFDTTWSISWVMSSQCNSIKTIGCYFHKKYDHNKSSEYKKDGTPFVLDIGTFNLTGFYSYDNISIAHSNVTTQSFVEMVSVPNDFLLNKASGVLGLGLKTDNYNPFFYTLLNQKKIKDPIFSIYLNRDRQSDRGGNVMLGFIEKRHVHKQVVKNRTIYDNITYLPVDNFAYWQFNMDKVVVRDVDKEGDLVLCAKGCKALADTSSNSILGPKEEVDKIHVAIKAQEFFLNRYTVNCDTVNKLPKIDFVLGGVKFNLTGPQYTVKISYHSVTLCVSAFIPSNTVQEQGRWVLGGAFLAEYYSIYNVYDKKIGFVRAA